jgi:hypothetical protein
VSIFKKDAAGFRQSIELMGYPRATVDAVWPEWWSAEAEDSLAAQTELRFTVARRLGLRPTTLFDGDAPEFVWQHEAKFKGLTALDDRERAAITSFGQAFTQTLLPAVAAPTKGPSLVGLSAEELRASIMDQPGSVVDIESLCVLCWALGVPIVHLRVFPLPAKRMAAMAVRVGDRFAILVGRDASFPAPTAFHIAHEIAHIALGHLANTAAIVDTKILGREHEDAEEAEADRFALTLLTGDPEPKIEMNQRARTGKQLAQASIAATRPPGGLRIEAGTLCLCYGYQTGDWHIAYASLRHVYLHEHAVWKVLNRFASNEIEWDALSIGGQAYVRAVLGAANIA